MSAQRMTAGPWYARACPDRRLKEWWIDGPPNSVNGETRGKPIAEVRHYHNGETEANARAIAALPELVEAARALLACVEYGMTDGTKANSQQLTDLRRILAKIDGE